MSTVSIRRRFKLGRQLTPAELEQLQQQPGVHEVSGARRLELRYSPLETDIDTLVTLLQGWQTQLRVSRWRMQWYRFTEANAKEHHQHQPACCNRVPGEGRRQS